MPPAPQPYWAVQFRLLERLDDFEHETQHSAMAAYAKGIGYKNGQVFGSLRAAVTGQRVSPPTFGTMEILGRAESIRRIELAIQSLREPAS